MTTYRAARRSVLVLLTGALLLGAATRTDAATIQHFYAFAANGVGSMSVDPFDPLLGTLDSVSVGITGNMTVTGTAAPNLVPGPPGMGAVPIPYAFDFTVTQDFFGLGGQYFDFTSPATFRLDGADTGVGGAFTLTTNFSYGFSVDAVTDLIGFALPTVSATNAAATPPPGGITGRRSDFLTIAGPIHEILLVQMLMPGPQAPAPAIAALATNGLLELRYTYTPAAVAVPEPAVAALFGTALGLVALRRRQWARRRA